MVLVNQVEDGLDVLQIEISIDLQRNVFSTFEFALKDLQTFTENLIGQLFLGVWNLFKRNLVVHCLRNFQKEILTNTKRDNLVGKFILWLVWSLAPSCFLKLRHHFLQYNIAAEMKK